MPRSAVRHEPEGSASTSIPALGIVYGISSFGLSQDLSITTKEAAAYIQSYFETYPGVKTFLERQVQQAKEQGYVTTMFGRRIFSLIHIYFQLH